MYKLYRNGKGDRYKTGMVHTFACPTYQRVCISGRPDGVSFPPFTELFRGANKDYFTIPYSWFDHEDWIYRIEARSWPCSVRDTRFKTERQLGHTVPWRFTPGTFDLLPLPREHLLRQVIFRKLGCAVEVVCHHNGRKVFVATLHRIRTRRGGWRCEIKTEIDYNSTTMK